MTEVWTPEESDIPTSIGGVYIKLIDSDGISANHIVQYHVQIMDQNNELMIERSGNLVPHLTQNQIDQLVAFMAAMRTKAETELL